MEKLRDLVAQVPVDVVLVYSPDRPARKYAYQALLIEEFAKAGSGVVFVKGPSSDSPEDVLLVQFQGMIAEYERAQIIERTRRGKTHRARQGTVNVLSGAPFGYRYVRKNEHADACYEVVAHEAAIVAELFRRYVEDGVAIADLARSHSPANRHSGALTLRRRLRTSTAGARRTIRQLLIGAAGRAGCWWRPAKIGFR